jgi:hypothetical protein
VNRYSAQQPTTQKPLLLAGMPATRIEESRSEVLGPWEGSTGERACLFHNGSAKRGWRSAAGTVRHDTIARRAQADKWAHKE